VTFKQLVQGVRAHHLGIGKRPDSINVGNAGEWREVLETAGLARWVLGLDSTSEQVGEWSDDQIGEFDGIPVRLLSVDGSAPEVLWPPRAPSVPDAS
jgi:hypothetical protein